MTNEAKTVKQLKEEIKDLPDDMPVYLKYYITDVPDERLSFRNRCLSININNLVFYDKETIKALVLGVY